MVRLQERHNFSDKVKECIFDGLYVDGNKEAGTDLRFQDGEGTVHHIRFVTL